MQTVDFFTPVVDDPAAYGRIAAANALSDVYAMGGRPLTALAIAGFPKDADRTILSEIFNGGLEGLREAGVALLGGHTVQDQEIKFGYAVTGEVDPARVWTNAGARAGDRLFLTKSLGTGVIATAIKFERAADARRGPGDRVDGAAESRRRRGARGAAAGRRARLHRCHRVRPDRPRDGNGEAPAGGRWRSTWRPCRFCEARSTWSNANTPGGGRTNQQHFGGGVDAAAAWIPGVSNCFTTPKRPADCWSRLPRTRFRLRSRRLEPCRGHGSSGRVSGTPANRAEGCPSRGAGQPGDTANGCRNAALNGINLRFGMLPNLSVLWVIFFILVLTFVVDRLLLKPVLGVIRRREEAIESARELARRSATEAQAAATEFERKTAAARAEMYREMDEMRRAALNRRAEIVAETRADAEAQVADAITRLDAETAAARRTLEVDAQALGAAAAERILGRKAS